MIRVCVQSISKYLLDYKNSKTRSQTRQEIEGGNCQHSFKNSINLPIVFLPRICVHTSKIDYEVFSIVLYCTYIVERLVLQTINVSTKQGNSSIFRSKIPSLLSRAVSNQERVIIAKDFLIDGRRSLIWEVRLVG